MAGTTQFPPRLKIAPGETVHFETVDASSGQLSRTSTAADLDQARPRARQPGHRPGVRRRRQARRCLEGHGAVVPPVGLGLDRQHPRLRPADRPVSRRAPAPLELRPRAQAGDVRPRRARAAQADVRHDRRGPGRARLAQHHSAAPRGRQHGRARHRRRHRAVPADRGGRRAVLGGRHACGARRRRGLRHGDRNRDRRQPEDRADQGRTPAHAALRHAGPGVEPSRQARATRSPPASAPT